MAINKTHFIPNLIIPGAGKSGTSTLHELLQLHPEISMSTKKEPHYWTNKNFNTFDAEKIENYKNLFTQKPNAKYKGESSTAYLVLPEFTVNFKNENAKFIIILRNPIDRLYSHFWWLKGIGSENSNLKTAVLKDFDDEPSNNSKLAEANYKHYYQFGLYSKWLSKFYSEYKSSNIHIVIYEDFIKNKLDELNNCFDFLELKRLSKTPKSHSNKTEQLKFSFLYKFSKLLAFNQLKVPKFIKRITPNGIKKYLRKDLSNKIYNLTKTNKEYPEISKQDREWLKNLYSEDVQKLKQLTGKQFNQWTDFN